MENDHQSKISNVSQLLKGFGLMLFFQLFLLLPLLAQQTENKDQCELITIYVRVDYLDSVRFACAEDLQLVLDSVAGINDLRINTFKQLVIFNMRSDVLMEQAVLEKKVRQAGFVPLKILYSKEPLIEVDEDVMF